MNAVQALFWFLERIDTLVWVGVTVLVWLVLCFVLWLRYRAARSRW